MMRLVGCLYVCVICGTLPAVAGEPPAQQAESAQAAPTTQPSSTTQTPSKPASTTKPASSTSPAHSSNPQHLTADEKRLISRGYRLEVQNGQKTFCRREVVLGSHLEKKVCGTADQLAQAQRTGREVTENSQRRGTNPQGN
jgi:hypothetical protein